MPGRHSASPVPVPLSMSLPLSFLSCHGTAMGDGQGAGGKGRWVMGWGNENTCKEIIRKLNKPKTTEGCYFRVQVKVKQRPRHSTFLTLSQDFKTRTRCKWAMEDAGIHGFQEGSKDSRPRTRIG